MGESTVGVLKFSEDYWLREIHSALEDFVGAHTDLTRMEATDQLLGVAGGLHEFVYSLAKEQAPEVVKQRTVWRNVREWVPSYTGSILDRIRNKRS